MQGGIGDRSLNMCNFCEDHDQYYEGSLIAHCVKLGLVGDLYMWVLIEPDSKQLALHILNKGTTKQLEFRRGINYCPMCGRSLFDVTD